MHDKVRELLESHPSKNMNGVRLSVNNEWVSAQDLEAGHSLIDSLLDVYQIPGFRYLKDSVKD
jgi:hypothetical protein